jgi:hypothetical protein
MKNTENTERNASSRAISSKLERAPKNYTFVEQRDFVTLSTRLWGTGNA